MKTADSFILMLQNSFRENWDRPALTDYQSTTLYYRDVARIIAKLHIIFRECGLERGDKVAICSRNRANWGVAFLASVTYGAVPVPILHEFKSSSIEFIVNHSDSKIFFAGGTILEGITPQHLPDLHAVINLDDWQIPVCHDQKILGVFKHLDDYFEKEYNGRFTPEDVVYEKEEDPNALAMISYTSGTSGFSKGVMIPYRAVVSNIHFAKDVLPQIKAGDKVVSILPMAHMYGMAFEFLYEICIGVHIYFLTRTPSPSIIMKAFEEVKPVIVISVPLIIEKIYKFKLQPFLKKQGVRFLQRIPILDKTMKEMICRVLSKSFGNKFDEIIIGGAPLNREAESFFTEIGFRFTVGYGMTECAPIIAYSSWNDRRNFSCGKAVLNMEIKIDSSDPENTPGEILVKGKNTMLGYYKDERATAEAFTEDGWMKTGDLGTMDADGFLYIKGRSKTMILGASGQNIYPEEIESLLDNMPYVIESLVVDAGGKLVALVYPDFNLVEKRGLDNYTLQAMMNENLELINKELPNYCKVSQIKIMPEEFEKTPKKSIKRYIYQNLYN